MNWKTFFYVGFWTVFCTVAILGFLVQLNAFINKQTQVEIIRNQQAILAELRKPDCSCKCMD